MLSTKVRKCISYTLNTVFVQFKNLSHSSVTTIVINIDIINDHLLQDVLKLAYFNDYKVLPILTQDSSFLYKIGGLRDEFSFRVHHFKFLVFIDFIESIRG